jgi:hypothetical protein
VILVEGAGVLADRVEQPAPAGLAGDPGTAAEALAQARRLQPGLSLDWVEGFHPNVHAADREIYASGLRAAGLRRTRTVRIRGVPGSGPVPRNRAHPEYHYIPTS